MTKTVPTLERVDAEHLVFPRDLGRLQICLEYGALSVVRGENAVRKPLHVALVGHHDCSLRFRDILRVRLSSYE